MRNRAARLPNLVTSITLASAQTCRSCTNPWRAPPACSSAITRPPPRARLPPRPRPPRPRAAARARRLEACTARAHPRLARSPWGGRAGAPRPRPPRSRPRQAGPLSYRPPRRHVRRLAPRQEALGALAQPARPGGRRRCRHAPSAQPHRPTSRARVVCHPNHSSFRACTQEESTVQLSARGPLLIACATVSAERTGT